jgi:hypothetical protein
MIGTGAKRGASALVAGVDRVDLLHSGDFAAG